MRNVDVSRHKMTRGAIPEKGNLLSTFTEIIEVFSGLAKFNRENVIQTIQNPCIT